MNELTNQSIIKYQEIHHLNQYIQKAFQITSLQGFFIIMRFIYIKHPNIL